MNKPANSKWNRAMFSHFQGAHSFFRSNKRLMGWIGVGLGAVLALSVLRSYYLRTQEGDAQTDMYQAVYYFEEDSLQRALEGDGIHYGFLDIIDEYNGTPSANLAQYYSGVCYLKTGEFSLAVEHLSAFKGHDLLLKGHAYALLGDAYAELQEYAKAGDYYKRAAKTHENELFSPIYLKKAAIVYEADAQKEAALACYETIKARYQNSRYYNEALQHVARLARTDLSELEEANDDENEGEEDAPDTNEDASSADIGANETPLSVDE